MLKVFTDLHHGDLYYALHLLFETRLKFELYRPIGLEWFYEGYWKIAEPYNNHLDTVNQFLAIGDCPGPGRGDNNLIKKDYFENNVCYLWEHSHEYYQKAITLETFKSMKFDIVMSTYQPHDYTFEKLQQLYQSSAKLIAQMGNVGQRSHLKNVIHSVPYNPEKYQNAVLLHQEIDTKLYSFIQPNINSKNVYSVVNCAQYLDVYNLYKSQLTDCNFKYYGIGSPDGVLFGSKGVGEKMRESNIGWSLKQLGGLGHSNMGWCYSGRPVITNMSQHRIFGGNAIKLFEPDITCIDIESNTTNENCKKIKTWLEPENTIKYGSNLRNRFLELVNYDAEELEFRRFLENLI